jgi:type 1 fimbria pilin
MSHTVQALKKKAGYRRWPLFLGLAGLLTSAEVMALCSAVDTPVNIPNIVVQRDTPTGSILGTTQVTTAVLCDLTGGDGVGWRMFPSPRMSDFGPSPLSDVRATTVPGVGIRWTNKRSGTTKNWSTAALNSYLKTDGRGLGNNTPFVDTVELVKIGPITSGVLPSMRLQYVYSSNPGNVVNAVDLHALVLPSIQIQVLACSVTQTMIVVPMGTNIPKNQFTGPGSTSSDVPFSIGLDCDRNARVNVQLDGSTVGDSAPGVLRLNAQADSAKGVGIQVLRNNMPITFGSPVFVGHSGVDGLFPIDFVARYYQVDGTVEAGIADASATFTMSYN